MPLRQTFYGGECPLGKFEIDVPAGGGCYTADPLEACAGNPEWGVSGCNFADLSNLKEFNLEKLCRCPSDMTWDEYDRLREQYTATSGKHTKPGFWEFVKENYKPPE